MRTTSDPNELLPLTQLGNQIVQERVHALPEFASSSKWGASAIAVQLSESMGFEVRVGFELRTPLEDPFQDVIAAWGSNKDEAVANAVAEWLEISLPPALAIHSTKDPNAKLGETQLGERIYSWRMAEGPLKVTSTGGEGDIDLARAELAKRSLFDRLGLAAALPLQRETPWLCMKLRLTRTDDGKLSQECRLNHADWPAGLELLKRFVLPGTGPLDIKQYLFLRRTGKRPAPRLAAAPAPDLPPAPAGKKSWWKVW